MCAALQVVVFFILYLVHHVFFMLLCSCERSYYSIKIFHVHLNSPKTLAVQQTCLLLFSTIIDIIILETK